MTEKTRIEIALLLPTVPDARDACVQRLGDLLKANDGIEAFREETRTCAWWLVGRTDGARFCSAVRRPASHRLASIRIVQRRFVGSFGAPSAVLSGVARAARCGVLIKGGGPLENLGTFSLGMVAFLVPATVLGLGLGAAVVLHEGSTLLVVLNALRLLAYQQFAPSQTKE